MTYEQWRPILGMEGLYEVSDLGNVRSLRSGRISALDLQKNGYVLAHFYRDGRHTARLVHRLVLEAFVGPQPPGLETLHLNNVRRDNRLINLRWGSRKENAADKRRHGTHVQGERVGNAKLTAADIRAIRARSGEPQKLLAEEFGCTNSNISYIQLRRSWRHV